MQPKMHIYNVTNPQGLFCQSKADVKYKQHLLLLKTIYSMTTCHYRKSLKENNVKGLKTYSYLKQKPYWDGQLEKQIRYKVLLILNNTDTPLFSFEILISLRWIINRQSLNEKQLSVQFHRNDLKQRPSIKSGTWNIPEHSGTFRNIPEHRIIMIIMRKNVQTNLNFGLARVTIWSAQNGHVGHVTCSFSQAEQLYFEMNRTEALSTVGNQLKKYMRSLIIDDILSEGGNVST